MTPVNELVVGSPGAGKSCSAIARIRDTPGEAAVVLDPHSHSLADGVMRVIDRPHMLFDNLTDLTHPIGFDVLVPAVATGDEGLMEEAAQSSGLADLMVRRRTGPSATGVPLAAAPLTEEWVVGLNDLFLTQRPRKPIRVYPCGLDPTSREYGDLIRDCTRDRTRNKFAGLAKLSPRALRAEVGPAARLVNGLFGNPAFVRRAEGHYPHGAFLQRRGLLVLERGEGIDDDCMRVLFGTVVQHTIRHVRRRATPEPCVRIYIDEATNAGLVGGTEVRALAEMRKYGQCFTLIVQNLDFPCGAETILQLCKRHVWFLCASYDLARKAATDVVCGLPADGRSRAERVAELTDDIMALKPGWHWVRDERGSRKEYLPLVENPWPDWPGLREQKYQEKLSWIRSQPVYRRTDGPPSSPSSSSSSPPPPSSSGSSPAERFRRG